VTDGRTDGQTDRQTDRVAMAIRRAIAVPAVARKKVKLGYVIVRSKA